VKEFLNSSIRVFFEMYGKGGDITGEELRG